MLRTYAAWEQMKSYLRNEQGQGLVEYALIIVLISLVAITAMTGAGEQITSIFETIKSSLVAPTP